MAEKTVKYDIDGYEAVTAALRELLNQYPGLVDGDEITFSSLSEDSGKAMFPSNGAVIESEQTFITGRKKEICLYPFYVVYRAAGLSEGRKASVKEWLDNLGKWLEKKTVLIGTEKYKLDSYPSLTDGRKLTEIKRNSPAYLDAVEENQSENWVIHITASYQFEY